MCIAGKFWGKKMTDTLVYYIRNACDLIQSTEDEDERNMLLDQIRAFCDDLEKQIFYSNEVIKELNDFDDEED